MNDYETLLMSSDYTDFLEASADYIKAIGMSGIEEARSERFLFDKFLEELFSPA